MSREWYTKHHQDNETAEFRDWFTNSYGFPGSYIDQDEYWTRRAFALMGWLASQSGRKEVQNDIRHF